MTADVKRQLLASYQRLLSSMDKLMQERTAVRLCLLSCYMCPLCRLASSLAAAVEMGCEAS